MGSNALYGVVYVFWDYLGELKKRNNINRLINDLNNHRTTK